MQKNAQMVAQIRKDGKNIFLGRYLNLEEAKKAREKKEIEIHLDFSPLATQ